jgi:hypothetical protein
LTPPSCPTAPTPAPPSRAELLSQRWITHILDRLAVRRATTLAHISRQDYLIQQQAEPGATLARKALADYTQITNRHHIGEIMIIARAIMLRRDAPPEHLPAIATVLHEACHEAALFRMSLVPTYPWRCPRRRGSALALVRE